MNKLLLLFPDPLYPELGHSAIMICKCALSTILDTGITLVLLYLMGPEWINII